MADGEIPVSGAGAADAGRAQPVRGTVPEGETLERRRRSSHHRRRSGRHGRFSPESGESIRRFEDISAIVFIVPTFLLVAGFLLWFICSRPQDPSMRPQGLLSLSFMMMCTGGGLLAAALVASWIRSAVKAVRDSREIARAARHSSGGSGSGDSGGSGHRRRHHHHHHHRHHHSTEE